MSYLEPFEIRLDQPLEKTYSPGEVVTGHVVTKALIDDNVKGLKLTFDGKAIVKWSEVTAQGVGPSSFCSVHKLEPITRTDSRTYFNFTQHLFGDGVNHCVFPPGENSYNFSFQIPSIDLPSTYASRFCKVEYLLEVKLTTSERVFDQFIAQKVIKVCPVVDLNKNPALLSPGGWQVTKNFSVFCYSHGDISIQVTAPRKGYHPGEVIDLTVDIDNSSSRTVMAVIARLVQEDTYLANGKIQVLNHELFNSSCQQRVTPYKSETFCLPVNVPRSAPPTDLGNCEIIKVRYKLQIIATVSGAFKNGFISIPNIPIRIGTLPGQNDSESDSGSSK